MTQLTPKIQFFEPGSTPDQISARIAALYPGLLERVMYSTPFGNADVYNATLFDGRIITCVIKREGDL
jgi:hypothetical protein